MLRGSTARDALESLSSGVDGLFFGLDTAGTVVFANSAALAQIGRGPSDLGRLTVADLIEGADLVWAARTIGRLFAQGPLPAPREWSVAGAGGTSLRFLLHLATFETDEGESIVALVARPLGAAAA